MEIFKQPGILNRFEGNFVIGQNNGLRKLQEVNKELLEEIDQHIANEKGT